MDMSSKDDPLLLRPCAISGSNPDQPWKGIVGTTGMELVLSNLKVIGGQYKGILLGRYTHNNGLLGSCLAGDPNGSCQDDQAPITLPCTQWTLNWKYCEHGQIVHGVYGRTVVCAKMASPTKDVELPPCTTPEIGRESEEQCTGTSVADSHPLKKAVKQGVIL